MKTTLTVVALASVLGACAPVVESELADGRAATPTATSPTTAAVAVDEAPGVRVVRPAAAADLVASEDVTVLDVRTPAEFAEGHLAGAVNIDMQAPDAVGRFAELDPDGSYVLYCRSGNRSSVVREHLRDLGFRDVADVFGGIVAWEDAGLEVVR